MPKILHNVYEGILLVGRDLLVESGYEGFSMRVVAARSGIGVGTLYNYFNSKQQLVAAILFSDWDIQYRKMSQISKSEGDLTDRLLAIYGELCQFLQGIHNTWLEGSTRVERSTNIQGIQQQRGAVRQQMINIISACLQAEYGQDCQWLSDCIARLFLSFANEQENGRDIVSKALVKLLK